MDRHLDVTFMVKLMPAYPREPPCVSVICAPARLRSGRARRTWDLHHRTNRCRVSLLVATRRLICLLLVSTSAKGRGLRMNPRSHNANRRMLPRRNALTVVPLPFLAVCALSRPCFAHVLCTSVWGWGHAQSERCNGKDEYTVLMRVCGRARGRDAVTLDRA